MRTTIDLPDEVHRAASLLARDRHESLSRTVSDLLRAALEQGAPSVHSDLDPLTGIPLVRLGRRITAEDVSAADDDA